MVIKEDLHEVYFNYILNWEYLEQPILESLHLNKSGIYHVKFMDFIPGLNKISIKDKSNVYKMIHYDNLGTSKLLRNHCYLLELIFDENSNLFSLNKILYNSTLKLTYV